MSNKQSLLTIASVLFLILISLVAYKGYGFYKLKDPDPLTFWDVSDEDNGSVIDHDLWQSILTKYVKPNSSMGINLFDYAGVSDEDYEVLETYIDNMASIDPREYMKEEQKAYWINLYNAITIKVILDEYPVDTIKATGNGLIGLGPWDDKVVSIVNIELSLNNIEHGILRRIWNDNRIHYGINCASIGCPDLAPLAYTGAQLDSQLAHAAKVFINNPRGVNFVDGTLILSSIFNWFVADFGDNEINLLVDLQKHTTPDLAKKIQAHNGPIEYDYDWRLNDTILANATSSNNNGANE